MLRFVVAFFLCCIWLYYSVNFYECSVKKLCKTTDIKKDTTFVVTPALVEKPLVFLPFSIVRNRSSVYAKGNSLSVLQPLYDSLNTLQSQELKITSFFNEEESGTEAFSRALSLRDSMQSFGINPLRVVIQVQQRSFSFDESQRFSEAFAYEFQKMSDVRLEAVNKTIASKMLYADFASEMFQPDNSLNSYTLELKDYLQRFPNAMVKIIGHTDIQGDEKANLWIGKERAKNVQQYFVSEGIDATRLQISSKGETEPIATNATKEGRRLNRRIEIHITNNN